jgi:hypothetical protein
MIAMAEIATAAKRDEEVILRMVPEIVAVIMDFPF